MISENLHEPFFVANGELSIPVQKGDNFKLLVL